MVSEKLARRYAVAVFSLASEQGVVDRIGDDLNTIANAIESDELAKGFFEAPIFERARKDEVLRAAFEGRVHEIALHTLLLLVRKRREALLAPLVTEFKKLQMTARGAEPLTVTTARQLGSDELRNMVERLERIYKTKFEVKQVVDSKLIGGVRILLGDRRVDGTVAGRLENLARTLFARN